MIQLLAEKDLHSFWICARHDNLESIVNPRHFELLTISIGLLLMITCCKGPTKVSREIMRILHFSGWIVREFLQEW